MEIAIAIGGIFLASICILALMLSVGRGEKRDLKDTVYLLHRGWKMHKVDRYKGAVYEFTKEGVRGVHYLGRAVKIERESQAPPKLKVPREMPNYLGEGK